MTVPTLQFLRDVCADGPRYYMSVGAHDNHSHHSLDALLADGQRFTQHDVYFCPASFIVGGKRNDSGVFARRAFVLDVDIRVFTAPEELHLQELHFADHASAIAAVDAMVADQHMPPYAYMVNSGSGLHVYWLAPADMNEGEWKPANDGFLARIQQRGEKRLVSDQTTSRRFSGLFRLPGSNNVKHGVALPCHVLAGAGTRLTPAWVAHFHNNAANLVAKTKAPAANSPVFNVPDFARCFTGGMRIPEDSLRVRPMDFFNECFVANLALSNPMGLRYDGWLTIARVLTNAADGRTLFHRMSALNANAYDPSETDTKFDDAARFRTPPNCKNLRDSVVGGDTTMCQSCPHFRADKPRSLHSAFELTQEHIRAVTPETEPQLIVPHIDGDYFRVDRPDLTMPSYLHFSPHNEFYVDSQGRLVGLRPGHDPQDPKPPIVINEEPFWFTKVWGEDRDPSGFASRPVSKLVAAYTSTGGYTETAPVTPGAVGDVQKFCAEVAGGDLYITKPEGLRKNSMARYLKYSMRELQRSPKYRSVAHKKLGWIETDKGWGFVLGNELFVGGRSIEQTKSMGHAEAVRHNWGLGRKGTFDKHLDAVMKYADPVYDPAVRLILLLGLGSPLLSLFSDATTMILLRGRTGAGKSSIMKVVNSLYGRPIKTLLSAQDTHRGKAAAVGGANHLFCYFDEITTQDNSAMRKLLMDTAASGTRNVNTDKGDPRMDDESSCTFFMASSNKSIHEYLPGLNPTDEAAKKRCLEITLPKMEGSELRKPEFNYINTTLKDNYGWLGSVFLDYIVDNRDQLTTMLLDAQARMTQRLSGNDEDRFDANALAVADVTERIIQALGWIPMGTSWTDDAVVQNKIREASRDDPTKVDRIDPTKRVAEHMELERFLSDMVNADARSFPLITDGVANIIPDMVSNFGGLRESRIEGQPRHIQRVVVLDFYLRSYCTRQESVLDNLIRVWSEQGHKIETLDRFDPGMFGLDSPRMSAGSKAYVMPWFYRDSGV